MRSRLLHPNVGTIVSLVIAGIVAWSGLPRSFAAEQLVDIPPWLKAHVGDGDGKISEVVLQRARALYLEKVSEGAARNPCYIAMDATRPAGFGRRFYIICEAERSFRAVPSGHGNGRKVAGLNFANGVRCAKNFSNSMDSKLTTGGAYVTAETRTSFKGYYRASAGRNATLTRSFLQFEGEGDTANARERAIGGHPAVLLRVQCRRKVPDSAYADEEGYVPFGTFVNYSGGRSNGCTSLDASGCRDDFRNGGGPADHALHLSRSRRHRRDRASCEGRPVAGARGTLLECLLLEGNRRAEILAERNAGADPPQIEKGSPSTPPQPLPICKGR